MDLTYFATKRARVVLGSVSVLVAALALNSFLGSASTTASLVPWAALAPVATTTTTTTTTTLAPAPSCLARQLRVSMGRGEAGLSNGLSVVVMTNVAHTCRLSGYPNLVGRTTVRPVGPLAVAKSGTYFGNLIPTNLSTGQRGELLLGTFSACTALNEPSNALNLANARANTYHSVTILLPKGAGALTVPHLYLNVACGLDESQLGVEGPPPGQYSASPGSVESLEASVTLPRSVQSGTTLRYVISLYNPDRKTVAWTNCPNYTESIFTAPQGTGAKIFSRTYQLNCARADSVLPRHSVTFVMDLPVGRVSSSSESKFSWQLDTGNGPYAGQVVRVQAPR